MEKKNPTARVFKYASPGAGATKSVVTLARTDRMLSAVHVLSEGGENNLHSHTHFDGFWFVLKGAVTFYGEGNKVLARLGPHEGILVPRRFKYWFESSGDEELELLQVEAFDISIPDDADLLDQRDNFEAPKASLSGFKLYEAEGELIEQVG